jgi:hypothetical protein
MPQKLAWARAHGVTPPAFVVEAAAREAAVSGEFHADDHKPCCPHCHKKALRAETTAAHGDSHQARGVVLLKALECQGYGPLGLLAASPALIPQPVKFSPPEPQFSGYLSPPALPLVSFFRDVPVPPPRG